MKAFWDTYAPSGVLNFGDALTQTIFKFFLGVDVTWAENTEAGLFAVGSIVEAIPDNYTGIVFGAGLMFEHSLKNLKKARVLAVRGRLTAERCGLKPEAVLMADLGLLAELLAYRMKVRTKYRGTFRHYVDKRPFDGIHLNPFEDPFTLVQRASMCSEIVSSSLHGIILADSLGIRNMWEPHDDVLGDGFKFQDYASSFGQTMEPYVWRMAPRDQVREKQIRLLRELWSLGEEIQCQT